MYGIVNKAIEDLVLQNFGPEIWETIKLRSGIDIDYFISNEPYDDQITYQLAIATSEETGLSLHDVLVAFGEFWVLKTGLEKYGALMEAGGSNLKEFLINLPNFHSRVMLIYPKLTPPEFRVSHLEEDSIHIHYYSSRQGLADFTKGLLIGLGKMYKVEDIEVTMIESREQGSDHEVFKVSWQ